MANCGIVIDPDPDGPIDSIIIGSPDSIGGDGQTTLLGPVTQRTVDGQPMTDSDPIGCYYY